MATALKLPLKMLRGDDYHETWALNDAATGASLIDPGDTLAFVIRTVQGNTALLTLAAVGSPTLTGFYAIDYVLGTFDITILKAALEAICTGLSLSAFEMMWPAFYQLGTEAVGRAPPLPAGHGVYVLVETMGDDPA